MITFDDAYAGALVLGVEELVRRAIPATVFVPPGLMGRTSFWWDDAVRSMEGSAMPTPIRERAITELGGRDDRVRERLWDGDGNLPNPPWWERPATVKILEEASRAPEIAFASHTWSHPNLETLSAEALREELRRPLRWLRDRFECAVPWLSYPYGRETALVRAEAEKAGYDGAFRIDGGWIRGSASDRFGLPRWNVPAGISAEGFLLRTGGLLCR